MSKQRSARLEQARRHCRDVTRDRARNFYYGLRLLPARKRDALYTLYAWMRQADDLVDDGTLCEADARRRLEVFRQWTMEVLNGRALPITDSGGESDSLLWIALSELAEQYTLGQQFFHDMVDGQLSDLDAAQYETWDELVRYCNQVASSVGLLCIEVWGYQDQRARECAVQRGVAFQLTNILRDVQEDNDVGRVYLPAELFQKHGLTTEQLQQWLNPQACRALVLECAERAQRYYNESSALESLISADCRPTLQAMTNIYHGLLERVRRNPSSVARGPRVRLNVLVKLSIAGRALWQKRFAGGEQLGAVS